MHKHCVYDNTKKKKKKIVRVTKRTQMKGTQRYQMQRRVGYGGFSQVYHVKDIFKQQHKVDKINYSTVSHRHVLRQLNNLAKINKQNSHIIKYDEVFIERNHAHIVSKYYHHIQYKNFLISCTIIDVKHYMCQLLIGLKKLASLKIIHRDIKPENFLYNNSTKRGEIIDFGLAQSFNEHKKVDNKAKYKKWRLGDKIKGTRGYIPLQVMLGKPATDKGDVWAAGIIFFQLITKKFRIFDYEEAIKFTSKFKNQRIKSIIIMILQLSVFYPNQIIQQCKIFGFQLKLPQNIQSCNFENISLIQGCDSQSLDLLKKLLDINPNSRIIAAQALEHQLFDQVRLYHNFQ